MGWTEKRPHNFEQIAESLTVDEMAAMTGANRDTVRSWYRRAGLQARAIPERNMRDDVSPLEREMAMRSWHGTATN